MGGTAVGETAVGEGEKWRHLTNKQAPAQGPAAPQGLAARPRVFPQSTDPKKAHCPQQRYLMKAALCPIVSSGALHHTPSVWLG